MHYAPKLCRIRRASRVLVAALLCCLGSHAATFAHERTQSYSTWQLTAEGARVRVRLSQLDLTHFPWGVLAPPERDAAAATYLTQALTLRSAAGPCTLVAPVRALHPGAGRLVYEWEVRCPSSDDLRLRSDILVDLVSSHLHFARVRTVHGKESEKVLNANDREWALAQVTASHGAAPTSFLGYLWLGMEHIWGGYDHLAFVIALLLPGGSLAQLAKVVTGFTVAHSITLALAVLGWVRPDPPSTEALIGLSIALVAIENLWQRVGSGWNGPWAVVLALLFAAGAAGCGYGRVSAVVLVGTTIFVACHFASLRRGAGVSGSRWGIAFLFGLIHGFGFASALTEVGMPAERLAAALAGFNLGVEVGQLAVVATLWPALRVITQARPRAYARLVELGSTAVLALGTFWFVSRAYAP